EATRKPGRPLESTRIGEQEGEGGRGRERAKRTNPKRASAIGRREGRSRIQSCQGRYRASGQRPATSEGPGREVDGRVSCCLRATKPGAAAGSDCGREWRPIAVAWIGGRYARHRDRQD